MRGSWLKKLVVVLTLTTFFLMSASTVSALPLFGKISFSEPAREILKKHRNFVDEFVWDKTDGGFYFWVRGNGEVEDRKRFTLFHANVILWIGGLQSQHPDERNLAMIEAAADYMIDHLYKGNGHWFERYDPDLDEKIDFFWNPRTEAYLAYALNEAYKHTGKFIYKKVAQETTDRQRKDFPNGQIFAEFSAGLDVGFRFPERMGHYLAADVNEDPTSLEYAKQFDEFYRGRYSVEDGVAPDGTRYKFRHGLAIIDQMLFGYLAKDEEAYNEAVENYKKYIVQGHQDHKTFKNDVPGEVADNGRDFYDKRLSMALIQWSKTGKEEFREEAILMWQEILRFWDSGAPYGFYVNLSQDRKTCFSINQPAQFIDLTAPEVVKIYDRQKAFWNHQLTVVVKDPNYFWNDHEFVGIGVDPRSLKLDVPNGLQYGNTFVESSECEDCYEVTSNFLSFSDVEVDVSVADYFANNQINLIQSESSIAITQWGGLNWWSYLYYVTLVLLMILVAGFIWKTTTNGKDPKKEKSSKDDDSKVVKKVVPKSTKKKTK